MKFKKEYVILAVVIIALVLYLMMHSTDRTHYDLPRLPEIAVDKISKIEVIKPDASYRLNHKEDQWVIDPQGYPADKTKASDMLNVIKNLNVTALVSDSGNYSRYKLDDAGKITVKVWTGDTLSREFMIGKPATTYRHTHVLIGDDTGVYHAEGNFRSDFDLDVDELRDKRVLNFDPQTIRQIQLTQGEKTVRLRQTAPSESTENEDKDASSNTQTGSEAQAVWQTAVGKAAKGTEVSSLLSMLSHLKCESFMADRQKEDFTDPVMTLSLKAGEEVYSLSVFNRDDADASDFPAVSSQNNDAFLLAEHQVDNMKKTVEAMQLEKP